MSKISLEEQIDALRMTSEGLVPTLNEKDAIDAAIRTLEWLSSNPDFVSLAKALYTDERINAVRKAFPGATIVAVNKIGDEPNN